MVFASLIFIFVFLPLNLILYYSSGNKAYRNWLLVIFSFVFYAWGEPVWIILMIISASADYMNALVIERYRHTHWAKFGVISSLVVNLGLLFIFKYSAFFYQNLNSIFNLSLEVPKFSLPIGISFYTFQTISYVLDVYRNEVKAQHSYMKFMLFVSLYHQLVAGPIVRYSHIAHEIDSRKVDIRDISAGVNRFCIGLFKKVFFANTAGELVGRYLDSDFAGLSVGGAWFGLFMFSIQIYFDFSGYSDMAIGLGRMFGFHYHENFNHPYISGTATEFWRRWHISLGTFFKDYLYVPLGGNRTHAVRNLLIVWFLTGLWHGASWNFVLWGLFFGFLIWAERAFLSRMLSSIPKVFSHLYLLTAVMFSWAIFYFEDIHRLKTFVGVLFGWFTRPFWDFELTTVLFSYSFWIVAAVIGCLPASAYIGNLFRRQFASSHPDSLRLASIPVNLVFLLVSTSLLVGKSYNPFLYFRF